MNNMKKQKIFETRKATMKKKAQELVSRSRADVCVLFFDPDGRSDQWPQDPAKAASVIHKYRAATWQRGKCKRGETLSLSDVLDAKINALRRQLDDAGGADLVFDLWEEELALLSKESLLALSGCLDSKIRDINGRIEALSSSSSSSAVVKPTMELDSFSDDQRFFANSQWPNGDDFWATMLNETICDAKCEDFGAMNSRLYLGQQVSVD